MNEVAANAPDTDDLHSEAEEMPPPEDSARRDKWVYRTVAALVVAPILIDAIRAALDGWIPTNDAAAAVLRAKYSLGSHPTLVGLYAWPSSVAIHATTYSAGPWQLWWMWAPVRVLGVSWGPLLAMAVLNSFFLLLAAWCVRRRLGFRSATFALVFLGLLTWSFGADAFHSPVPVVAAAAPFAAFCFAAWALAAGDEGVLPVVVGLAAYLVLCHPSTAVLVPVIGLSALVLWFVSMRRRRRTEPEGWDGYRRRSIRAAVVANRHRRRALDPATDPGIHHQSGKPHPPVPGVGPDSDVDEPATQLGVDLHVVQRIAVLVPWQHRPFVPHRHRANSVVGGDGAHGGAVRRGRTCRGMARIPSRRPSRVQRRGARRVRHVRVLAALPAVPFRAVLPSDLGGRDVRHVRVRLRVRAGTSGADEGRGARGGGRVHRGARAAESPPAADSALHREHRAGAQHQPRPRPADPPGGAWSRNGAHGAGLQRHVPVCGRARGRHRRCRCPRSAPITSCRSRATRTPPARVTAPG